MKAKVIIISFFIFACVNGVNGYFVYLHQELLKDWQGWALAGAPMGAWLLFSIIVCLLPSDSGKKKPKKKGARKPEEEGEPPGPEAPDTKEPSEGSEHVEHQEEDAERLYPKEIAVVQILGLLQREGRLLDFLQEDIEPYDDAQIGAAVREVHRGCRAALMDTLGLEPVLNAPEGSEVEIEEDFDPTKIRLIGNLQGNPPYKGIIRHCGWRFTKINLPKWTGKEKTDILAPAEVEVQ